MSLQINISATIQNFMDIFNEELANRLPSWKNEVESRIMSNFAKSHSRAKVDFEIEKIGKKIIAFLEANPIALADSFGTGSYMLEDNPLYEEYINSSDYNPERRGKGKAIRGRPAGEYTSIFGETRHSHGSLAGINIEGWKFKTKYGKYYQILPIKPSYALQDAEKYFFRTELPKVFENTAKRFTIKFFDRKVK